MKTLTLDLFKKDRVYYKCKDDKGRIVKLKITAKSNGLSLKKHELLVRDVSLRTKYGTELIYDMEAENETKEITTLQVRYNIYLTNECKNLGGRWDNKNKVWVFPKIIEDKVEELELKYCTDFINIEIKSLKEIEFERVPAHFLGYLLANYNNLAENINLVQGISLINGTFKRRGSRKYWIILIEKGMILRLEIPKNIADDYLKCFNDKSEWKLRII